MVLLTKRKEIQLFLPFTFVEESQNTVLEQYLVKEKSHITEIARSNGGSRISRTVD